MKANLSEAHTAHNQKTRAYLGLIFVIVMWGISPLVTLYLYKYYSPTIRIAFTSLISAVALLLISRRQWKLLNKSYFLVAVPTGFFLAAANILQKIGLQYTTPAHYSFLENLSCIIVPVLLFVFTGKKPGFLTIFAAVLCLISTMVLTGGNLSGGGASAFGDILCALAGAFYGVNIAATGAFTKKMSAPLYLMIQIFVEAALSFLAAIVFNFTGMEKIIFNFDLRLVFFNIFTVLITSTFCWLIRTNAMKHVDASVVAVMMPFSSVVTTVISIVLGKDVLTFDLIIGVLLGLLAIVLSGLGDGKRRKGNISKTAAGSLDNDMPK